MGHLAGKDKYRALGRKIDGLTLRAPWNETFHSLLKELYSADEADLVVRMPYRPSTAARIAQVAGLDPARVETLLDRLCDKGLVVDILHGGGYQYVVSPLAIGIFELTMMRKGDGLDMRNWARLFHAYWDGGEVWKANLGQGQQLQLMRTLPHEGTVAAEDFVEVLDYEKAAAIVESHDVFAVGICSCRHEKSHLGDRLCEIPLESCVSFRGAARHLVRHNMARHISKAEMHDRLVQARESKLVINADNVRRDVSFMCLCCGCCCNVLRGISQFGYPHAVVTSNYLAHSDDATCDGCLKCKTACPIGAISLERLEAPLGKKKARPSIDDSICIGCGVCAHVCERKAMRLKARAKRVIYPEDTMERVLVQCLEAGTLQNLLFDDPNRLTDRFMQAFLGAFLRLPPVKKAMLGDALRSRFLARFRQAGN